MTPDLFTVAGEAPIVVARCSAVESLIAYTEGVLLALLSKTNIEDAHLAVIKAQERFRNHYAPAARRGLVGIEGPCLLKEKV